MVALTILSLDSIRDVEFKDVHIYNISNIECHGEVLPRADEGRFMLCDTIHLCIAGGVCSSRHT